MTTPPFDPNVNPKAQAKAAKAYAKATRPWFKKKRFALPIAFFVLVGIGSAMSGNDDEPKSTSAASTSQSNEDTAVDATPDAAAADAAAATPEPTTAPRKAVETVKVDAKTILKDYEDNELAADKKYKGQTIEVTGTVDKIDTELLDSDQYVLRISDGSEFSFLTVNCNDMSEKELSTLTTGDEVTAIGKFDDGGDLGIELKKCKLA